MYTVQEVSKISGVTVKALHYYHQIGLLLPSRIGKNNYRYYSDQEIEQLQIILFYRSLDFSLDDIGKMLERNSPRIEILERQRELLYLKKKDVSKMLETIDKTIDKEKQHKKMENKELFDGLEDVEPINRTFQNMFVIMSKPMYIEYLLIGIFLTVIFGSFLIWGIPKTATDRAGYQDWINALPRSSQIIACSTFLIMGLVTIGLSIYNLFFRSTKADLEKINRKYLLLEKKQKETMKKLGRFNEKDDVDKDK